MEREAHSEMMIRIIAGSILTMSRRLTASFFSFIEKKRIRKYFLFKIVTEYREPPPQVLLMIVQKATHLR
jgi:hypothetical protein